MQEEIICRLIDTGIATPTTTGVWWKIPIHYSDFKFTVARQRLKERMAFLNETIKPQIIFVNYNQISIAHVQFYVYYLLIGCAGAFCVFLVERIY